MNISLLKEIFEKRTPQPFHNYNFFSVLVPLVLHDGTTHVLFEIRADHLKRQPNEICFPGGKVEKKESPKMGAIRETHEELNIPIDKIKIISELDYVMTYSNFTLYSFLGEISYEDVINNGVSKEEVQDVFLVPFDFFLNTQPLLHEVEVKPHIKDDFPFDLIQNGKDYNWRTGKMPIYFYQYEDKVIWGLTARVIANMVRIIKENE